MAVRKIIEIDEELCNGCGDCIIGCEEGALAIVDGKAKLVRDSFCDGLGACLGDCPTGALKIIARDADEFDEEAVEEHLKIARPQGKNPAPSHGHGGGCPGSAARSMQAASSPVVSSEGIPSQLTHWPVQLTLVQPTAPFLDDADVLLSADCVPFAMPDFHQRFLAGGHPVLVACPKLDDVEPYIAKIQMMIDNSSIKSLSILRMEVPCCGGLCQIVKEAMQKVTRQIPVKEVIIGLDGTVRSETAW